MQYYSCSHNKVNHNYYQTFPLKQIQGLLLDKFEFTYSLIILKMNQSIERNYPLYGPIDSKYPKL